MIVHADTAGDRCHLLASRTGTCTCKKDYEGQLPGVSFVAVSQDSMREVHAIPGGT